MSPSSKPFSDQIRQFGLYVNGLRVPEQGLDLKINPFSGRVIGRVFLVPQESFIFDEMTPTESSIEINILHPRSF